MPVISNVSYVFLSSRLLVWNLFMTVKTLEYRVFCVHYLPSLALIVPPHVSSVYFHVATVTFRTVKLHWWTVFTSTQFYPFIRIIIIHLFPPFFNILHLCIYSIAVFLINTLVICFRYRLSIYQPPPSSITQEYESSRTRLVSCFMYEGWYGFELTSLCHRHLSYLDLCIMLFNKINIWVQ